VFRPSSACSAGAQISSGFAYGYGWISTAWMTLKIDEVAPMPSVSESTATAKNPGLRRNERSA
jgi:hypothetical protein